ncbi:MAG: hypothetical protein M3R63_00265 [Actinomycetota bacterium]|nr:hypothetical protein [Actinomycetota bacterium]
MRRSGRWMGHLLTAVAFAAFLALGVWQYERSQSVTGDFQNLGYALQWPLFAVFAVVAWWRVQSLERRRAERLAVPTPPPAPTVRPVPATRPVRGKQPVSAEQSDQEDETDDDLAAYNRFLARLAARDAEG